MKNRHALGAVGLIGVALTAVLYAQDVRRIFEPYEFHSTSGIALGLNSPITFFSSSSGHDGDESDLRYARCDLTNTQVLSLHLHTGAVTCIAAPGANKYVDVIGGQALFNYTGAYTVGASDDLRLYYGSRATGSVASGAIETTGLLDATSDQVFFFAGALAGTKPTVNGAVAVQNTSGAAFGGGNASNILSFVMLYRVQETGF